LLLRAGILFFYFKAKIKVMSLIYNLFLMA